jgi:hypothetical protein
LVPKASDDDDPAFVREDEDDEDDDIKPVLTTPAYVSSEVSIEIVGGKVVRDEVDEFVSHCITMRCRQRRGVSTSRCRSS